jgi:hypothetical protein
LAPDPSTTAALPTQTLPPVPPRAAAAILGTMVLLIVLLTAVLIETTWGNPVSATESPAAPSTTVAHR